MAYTPQTWTDGVSKLNATRMGHIETGIADIHNLVDAKGDLYTATAADTPARLAVGANNTLLVADSAQSTGLKYSALTNSMVDAAAAIAYSKLNLASSIVNADISSSAAISVSKLSGAYTDYSGSFAWTSNGTAPALGNSTVIAKYLQIGKLVHYFFVLTFGSTATFGTGSYRFSLPVACASTSNRPLGHAEMSDNSSGNYGIATVAPITTTSTVQLVYAGTYLGAATVTAQTAPWTWAQSDLISANLVYLAA